MATAGAVTPVPRKRVIVSWSGGKDCCMALHTLRASDEYEVAGLLAIVRQEDGTVGMHGVSCDLIARQAEALGLPLTVAELPDGASNLVYEQIVAAALAPLIGEGIRTVAFGDLFLQDIRSYRERQMAQIGVRAIFPVWARETRAFVAEFIALGFQAIVVAADTMRLDPHFAGRLIDTSLVADLPADVDRCGENGEFHSFVFDGPGFHIAIAFTVGDRRMEAGVCYRTIIPV